MNYTIPYSSTPEAKSSKMRKRVWFSIYSILLACVGAHFGEAGMIAQQKHMQEAIDIMFKDIKPVAPVSCPNVIPIDRLDDFIKKENNA